MKLLGILTSVIEDTLDKKIAVEALASIAEVSPRHFSIAFKDATGFAVYQLVLRKRVVRARRLLSETDLSLAERAPTTGFTHQAHMTRTLKRLIGRTPAQVRAGGK